MTEHVEVRGGAYYDSVSLLQVSRQVAAAAGVDAAQVAMATELNLDVVRGMGFTVPEDVHPNDLVVAIRGADDAAVGSGLAALDAALAGLKAAGAAAGGFGEAPAPRTLGRAIDAVDATLAVVSVPGRYATVEAWDAIGRGVSVMVFSDNVSVADEVALKDAAAARDVLVMGPDCGTAVVGGVALGFANVVERGPIGIVAASGTGAQQVMALLDAAGVGVSHCLGVGGRDLSAAVAGRSARQALAAFAADDATEAVVVVSKPPDPDVLQDLEEYAAGLGKPVHWATLGPGRPDLTAAVASALRADGREVPEWPHWDPSTDGRGGNSATPTPATPTPATPTPAQSSEDPTSPDSSDPPNTAGSRGAGSQGRFLRGLFCGGTLADEAMLIASRELGGIRSNIALTPELDLGGELRAEDHVVIDFGDDALTQGRAHPMIDPSLRLERIAAEARDPSCGVLLLDLVLGHGAHSDPALELAAAIRDARSTARAQGRELPVVVSLTGTRGDPQGLSQTAAALTGVGAWVHLSNAEATRRALAMLEATDTDSDTDTDTVPHEANR